MNHKEKMERAELLRSILLGMYENINNFSQIGMVTSKDVYSKITELLQELYDLSKRG